MRRSLHSRDNWWTPEHVRQRVLTTWNITLDAAATHDSAVVPNYLGPDHPETARRDALQVSWTLYAQTGAVYLNPPYRTSLLRPFLAKAVETQAEGATVVALLPAATSTQWWAENILLPRAEVEFLTGRLRFGGPHVSGGPAPFASAIVTWEA